MEADKRSFYFETGTSCGIRTFENLTQAKAGILRELGPAATPIAVRYATSADLQKVKSGKGKGG